MISTDEGYIKYNINWEKTGPMHIDNLSELADCRDYLYKRNLIGCYDNGVGFGNVSLRIKGTETFIITGSGTGCLKQISNHHFSIVTAFDIPANTLSCRGPVKASSEALTHAACYVAYSSIYAVIHIHQFDLWKKLLDSNLSTIVHAEYGSVEMATRVKDIIMKSQTTQNIIVMAGHKGGIITYGDNIAAACNVLTEYLDNIP